MSAPAPEWAQHAMGLRRAARAACDARDGAKCRALLDEARAIDPRGDEAPDVQALRRLAAGFR